MPPETRWFTIKSHKLSEGYYTGSSSLICHWWRKILHSVKYFEHLYGMDILPQNKRKPYTFGRNIKITIRNKHCIGSKILLIYWRFFGNSHRVGKNPGFFKKTQPSGFFWFFLGFLGSLGFFWVFCPDERVFRVFSVSRILLGASRL